MFYCEPCRIEKGYPESPGHRHSNGKCEICGQSAICHDVPSYLLPEPALSSAAAEAVAEPSRWDELGRELRETRRRVDAAEAQVKKAENALAFAQIPLQKALEEAKEDLRVAKLEHHDAKTDLYTYAYGGIPQRRESRDGR